MNTKHEFLIVTGLALSATGIYGLLYSRGLDEAAPAEPATPSSTALVRPATPAPTLKARVMSDGLYDHGHWRGKSQLVDVNHDGKLDIITSIRRWEPGKLGEGLYVWLGDGEGGWTQSNEGISRTMGYGGSHVADANGDGHLDIAFSGHDVSPQVLLGDGAGTWRAASEGIWTEGVCADVALGDLDGDGTAELLTMGMFPRAGGLYAYRLDAELESWNFFAELQDKEVFGSEVELFDLDADGDLEVVAATEKGLRVWQFEPGDPNGEARDQFIDWSAGLPTPEIGGSDLGIDAADVDGDGDLEILLSGMIYEGHPPLRLYDWDGEAWTSEDAGLPNDEAVFDAVFAQIDGTGPLEIVAGGKHGISILSETAPGRYERVGRLDDTIGVVNIATGDVTGDGRDEVLYIGFQGVSVLEVPELTQGGTL